MAFERGPSFDDSYPVGKFGKIINTNGHDRINRWVHFGDRSGVVQQGTMLLEKKGCQAGWRKDAPTQPIPSILRIPWRIRSKVTHHEGVNLEGIFQSLFTYLIEIYLLAEHRRHQILPGLVRDGDIGFQGIVLHLSTSTAYLYRRYDNLLLPEHGRSAPPCQESGARGWLLFRRYNPKER